ncbi:Nup133 N terminal like-domain-containing protein [Lipomyces oligophaga]|uniref:Nup133 N terminal like-domain-containing protein n=1 Tax=Lipomyces oligophaga TaxID=45792 RepID=UPI0034CDB4A7
MQSLQVSKKRIARNQARRSRQVSGLLRQASTTSTSEHESTSAVVVSNDRSSDRVNDRDRTVLVPHSLGSSEYKVRDSAIEYTRNQKYCVLKLPALPNLLQSSDDTFLSGSLDSTTDYALLVSPTSAFVWRYTSPDHLPNTISFPIVNATGALPLGVLVSPSAGDSEPGLVLVHPHTGELTYWEAVGEALTEGLLHRKKGVEAKIGLYQGETLEYLQNIEPVGVVVSTSSGRFVLVELYDNIGRPGITCTVMRGTGTGMWSNLKGVLKLGGTRRDVVSIKPGKYLGRTERLFATINIRAGVAMWHCSRGGYYNLTTELELKDLLLDSIRDIYPQSEQTFEAHDIELLPDDDHRALILTSFTYDEESNLGPERIFYMLFTVSFDGERAEIISAHRITCYSGQSTKRPKLLLPKPGYTAFIVLSHAVVMLSTILEPKSDTTTFKWEDFVEFKKGSIDVIITGSEDMRAVNDQITRHAGVVLVSRGVGVVRLERFEDDAGSGTSDSRAEVIKSKLEQAVYYGFEDESPLEFGQSREVAYDINDIENAIAVVSDEIISANSVYSTDYPDTLESLTLRMKALSRLSEQMRSVFPLLSQECRLKMLTKMEKCEASRNIWGYWKMTGAGSLVDRNSSINQVVRELSGTNLSAEVWIRTQVTKIGELAVLFALKSLVRAPNHAGVDREEMVRQVAEANELLIILLTGSAYFVRHYYKTAIFGLAENAWDGSSTEPWTSTWDVLNVLGKQFDITRELASQIWQDPGSEGQVELLSNQLLGLAECLCRAYDERIVYYETGPMTSEASEQARDLRKLYVEQRKTWIKPLLEFGFQDKAYELAEQYQDFRLLSEMCREEKSSLDRLSKKGKADDVAEEVMQARERLAGRIKHYFDDYGYEFAAVLYEEYIESGHVTELFVAYPGYRTYLERFLNCGKYDRMAWIHDVQVGDYQQAAGRLRKVAAASEDSTVNKLVQLSIAKLCLLQATAEGKGDDHEGEEEVDRLLGKIRWVREQEVKEAEAAEDFEMIDNV